MNKELKNKIVSSYEASTPDTLDSIKEKIQATSMLEEEAIVTPIHRYKRFSTTLAVACSLAAAVLIFISGVKTGDGSFRSTYKATAATDACMPEPAQAIEEEAVYEDLAPKMQVCNEIMADTAAEYENDAEIDYERVFSESEAARTDIEINFGLKLSLDEEFYVVGFETDEALAPIYQESDIVGLRVEVAFKYIVATLYMNGYFNDDSEALHLSIDTVSKDYYESLESTFTSIMAELPINNIVNVEVVYSR